MTDINALSAANEKRWANANLTRDFTATAKRLLAAKPRYQAVEAKTGVPWWAIAVIHMRESSQNWAGSLAQGDAWNKVSTHIPKGRGPFNSWEEAAIDALVECGPYLARKRDWSTGAALANLELYNGAGYANKARPSPYLWAGTDQYQSGKYVADGKYDAGVVDVQPGCAGMLKAMMALDATIKLEAPKVTTVTPAVKPATPPKTPAKTATKTGGLVVAAGTAATIAHQSGINPAIIIAVVAAVALAAFLVWKLRK